MREPTDDKATRLFAIVASEARTAVVLRRGPSKQVEMLHWDLTSDTVTPGQWLSGRIYNEKCGLSPDGRLFVYFAGKFKTKLGTFTAICRPPFFTALALWADGSTWGGGGFFAGNRRLILNYGHVLGELHDARTIPPDFELADIVAYRQQHGPAPTPESSQGWTLVADGVAGTATATLKFAFAEPRVHNKPNPAHPRLTLERRLLGHYEVNGPSSVYEYRIVERPGVRSDDLGRLDWADWDHDGSLLYADDGRLYRRRQYNSLRSDPGDPALVADLRAHTFTNVIPPDRARVWP